MSKHMFGSDTPNHAFSNWTHQIRLALVGQTKSKPR